MLKYKWFEPRDAEFDMAIVLPNHLGASLDKDFGYKAKRVADYSGKVVLAYERPYTGSQATFTLAAKRALARHHYVSTAAQTGRELDRIISYVGFRKFVLSGNSAAALDVAVIAATETLQPDFLALGDMVGLRNARLVEGICTWFRHQQMENGLPAEVRNSDPGPPVAGSEMVARAVKEIGLYGGIWRTPLGFSTLVRLASHDNFENMAINVEFPGNTFTETPATLQALASSLNTLRPAASARPFVASFEPDRYHSYYNDPGNYTAFIGRTLALGG